MTAKTLADAMFLASLAGATIPLGGALAAGQKFLKNWYQQEIRHTVAAFGGGALLSAVALVLVPEAIERLPAGSDGAWRAAGDGLDVGDTAEPADRCAEPA